MKNKDIMEALVDAVHDTIFECWKHEGFIGRFTRDSANFVIDGKEYVLLLTEVLDGEHWTKKMEGV